MAAYDGSPKNGDMDGGLASRFSERGPGNPRVEATCIQWSTMTIHV